MSKVKYYCSCKKGIITHIHTKMRETVVTEDGQCYYCEHYAIASLHRPRYDASPFVVDDPKLMAIRDDKRTKRAMVASGYLC